MKIKNLFLISFFLISSSCFASSKKVTEVDTRRFFSSMPIYSKNKNSPDPKMREVSEYAANIVADGFIKYSGDEVGEITLGVIMDDVVKHKELVDMISKKAEKAGVNVSLGEYTKKYNEKNNKNNNKGISVSK